MCQKLLQASWQIHRSYRFSQNLMGDPVLTQCYGSKLVICLWYATSSYEKVRERNSSWMVMPLNFSAITFQANAKNEEATPRLNYCYLKIIHIFGACLIQKKSKQKQFRGVVEDILFWKPSRNFSFFYYNLGNSRQNKAQPLDNPENCFRFLGNSKAPKTKTPGNPTLFFLGHHWKFIFIFN